MPPRYAGLSARQAAARCRAEARFRRGPVLPILECGNRDADAAPADLLCARPGLGRSRRRPPDRAGSGGQRHGPPAMVRQAVRRTVASHAPAPGTSRDHRVGGGRAGRPGGGQARAPGPAEPLPPALPVRRRGAHHGPGLRDSPVPRRRVGGRPLPAGAVRRGAAGRPAARGRALVRPAGARARAGRAAAARRRPGHRGHRHPVAHRLALPRTRLPARVLGRRHDAGPAAGARRLGRPGGRAVHPLPRCGGGRADRRGPGARVPGGGGGPG